MKGTYFRSQVGGLSLCQHRDPIIPTKPNRDTNGTTSIFTRGLKIKVYYKTDRDLSIHPWISSLDRIFSMLLRQKLTRFPPPYLKEETSSRIKISNSLRLQRFFSLSPFLILFPLPLPYYSKKSPFLYRFPSPFLPSFVLINFLSSINKVQRIMDILPLASKARNLPALCTSRLWMAFKPFYHRLSN